MNLSVESYTLMQKLGDFKGLETIKKAGFRLPGGSVVKNPPANAGDTGLIPGPGRFHMPWGN